MSETREGESQEREAFRTQQRLLRATFDAVRERKVAKLAEDGTHYGTLIIGPNSTVVIRTIEGCFEEYTPDVAAEVFTWDDPDPRFGTRFIERR